MQGTYVKVFALSFALIMGAAALLQSTPPGTVAPPPDAQPLEFARAVYVGTVLNSPLIVSTEPFRSGDVGMRVSGPGIPEGATIATIDSSTSATLSVPANATTATLALVVPVEDVRAVEVATILASPLITSPTGAFGPSDEGKVIVAPGIPVGTIITSVQGPSTATLSAPATVTVSAPAQLAPVSSVTPVQIIAVESSPVIGALPADLGSETSPPATTVAPPVPAVPVLAPPVLFGPQFQGQIIAAPMIPAGTLITSVQSPSLAVMSAPATVSSALPTKIITPDLTHQPLLLQLLIDGQHSVSGTIGNSNFWPGNRASGQVQLTFDGLLSQPPDLNLYRLDFDFRSVVNETEWQFPVESGREMLRHLVVTKLQYGDDDLLQDPGRNLTREIDDSPFVGNGDGRLDLEEMETGANDLPAPQLGDGTTFALEITFRENGLPQNELQGDRTILTMVFELRDLLNAKLN